MSGPGLSGPFVGIGAAPLSIAGQASALATRSRSRRVAPSGICFPESLFIAGVPLPFHFKRHLENARVAVRARNFTEVWVRQASDRVSEMSCVQNVERL